MIKPSARLLRKLSRHRCGIEHFMHEVEHNPVLHKHIGHQLIAGAVIAQAAEMIDQVDRE